MEKNEKKILQYFSGMMNDDDKGKFEIDLRNDEDLNARFKKIEMQLSKMDVSQKGINLDDRYFNSILPNVRIKIDKKTPVFFQPKIVYSFASIISAVILLFILLPISTNNEFSIKDYEDELATIINDDEARESIEDIIYENYTYSLADNSFNQISEQLDLDLLNELTIDNNIKNDINNIHYSESYEYIEDLDEQELNAIINELSETKIL